MCGARLALLRQAVGVATPELSSPAPGFIPCKPVPLKTPNSLQPSLQHSALPTDCIALNAPFLP